MENTDTRQFEWEMKHREEGRGIIGQYSDWGINEKGEITLGKEIGHADTEANK